EEATLPFVLGEPGEHRQQVLHGRVERTVDVGEVLNPRHVPYVVAPGEEVTHAARRERLQRLVQPARVVRVVEVLEHDLPVPRKVRQRLPAKSDGVVELVAGEWFVELDETGRERRGVPVEGREDETVPDLDRQ